MRLTDLTLAEAAKKIETKKLSPVELTKACLERVEKYDDTLKTFISVYADEAIEIAKANERLISSGNYLGPLHGIPMALKDNVAVANKVTTAGSMILKNEVSKEDATVTKNLRSSGAIILGKLNMHEFAWGGTSENPHYGTVRNPWDTERFAAGSSGGSGASVSAGMCLASIGTDTGGSIRLPSAINGLAGIRPTYGRVSNAGIIPLAWSMDTAGPMARTAEDCAIVFQHLAGHDSKDPNSARVLVDDYISNLRKPLKGIKIGVVPGYFFHHLQQPVHDAVKEALEVYQQLGAEIVEVDIKNIHGNISAQLTIESVEPSAYHQKWLREHPESYGEDVRILLEMGEMLLATHYVQAQRYRALLRNEFMEAFDKVDVFICPTLPFTATKVGTMKVVIENGVEEDMLAAIMQFTGVPSLTGLPSLNVPCGFDDDGMPIGMQIIGKPFDEALLFNMGTVYQDNTNHHEQRPPLP